MKKKDLMRILKANPHIDMKTLAEGLKLTRERRECAARRTPLEIADPCCGKRMGALGSPGQRYSTFLRVR